MNDIVLREIDDTLQRRIERVAQRHRWSVPEALAQLLEAGLKAHGVAAPPPVLDGGEHDALACAIAAMQDLPDDPGFALIGRCPAR